MSDDFIAKMRAAGKLAADTLTMIGRHVKAGVTTNALNDICHEYMVKANAKPAPLTKGFPKSICTSPNYVICHGIPDDKPLKDGMILNIDVSLCLDGHFADTCKMFEIGKVPVIAKRIIKCAHECIYSAIRAVKPGTSLGTIGKIIESIANNYGYSVVREFCGHGIGTSLHEKNFQVLHYYEPKYDKFLLEPGMTFTIEPMINVGKAALQILADGWTAVTKDRSLSAQFEHTILVTETGYEILTLREEEINQI